MRLIVVAGGAQALGEADNLLEGGAHRYEVTDLAANVHVDADNRRCPAGSAASA